MSSLLLDIRAVSPGLSKDAKKMNSLVREVSSHRLRNGTGRLVQHSFEQLQGIYQKCKIASWDGLDACAIPITAYEDALEFLNNTLWEDDIPDPEIDADETGAIRFEWIANSTAMYSITFYGEKLLGFSRNWGEGDSNYGTKNLHDTATYQSVLGDIMRTFQERGNVPTARSGQNRGEHYQIHF